MFTLVIGGAASGKSEYAEAHVIGLGGERLYIATMEPFGPEAEARIARHRAMRAAKGFETVERYTDLRNAPVPEDSNVLLEDMGNLVANEMFSPSGGGIGAVISGVETLAARCRHLTVVTNEVFSGGTDYEGDTLRYMAALGEVNCRLAELADRVAEVICGIPRIRKEAGYEDS